MSKTQKKLSTISANGLKKVTAFAITVVAAGQTFAATDTLTAPSFDNANVMIIAGALIAGLAAFWGIKKAISLMSR